MMDEMKKKKHSGFTLLELMIVLGIIAVLTAVLVPTMNSYLTRSRLNTANSNAKVLFNSIQTIMQEYEFSERTSSTSLFYGSEKEGTIYLAGLNGTLTAYNAINSSNIPATLTAAQIGADYNTAASSTLGSRLGRLFADYQEVAWVAYIENYSVRAVVCATNRETDYIGGYPTKATTRGELGDNLTVFTKDKISNYATTAWTT